LDFNPPCRFEIIQQYEYVVEFYLCPQSGHGNIGHAIQQTTYFAMENYFCLNSLPKVE